MNAVVEYYDGYGSAEGSDPVHAVEIHFTYHQVFDEQYNSEIDEVVRKLIHKDFKGQGIIFDLNGHRTAVYKF